MAQVDVHHQHFSQLSASITTTCHVCGNKTQATSDLSSIDCGYPKTVAERKQECRPGIKTNTPMGNHIKRQENRCRACQRV